MAASFSRMVTGSSQLSFSTQLFSAKGGTDAAGEFRKVAGLFQYLVSLFPLPFVEEVLPFGLFVTDGARPVAERYATIHATGCLAAAVAAVECLFYFAEIVDTIFDRPITCLLSMYGEECSWICHCCFDFKSEK